MTSRILIGIIAILILAAGAWYLFLRTPAPTSSGGAPSGQNLFGEPATSTNPAGTGGSGDQTILQTYSGSTVAVPNLTEGKTAIPVGTNQFYFLTDNQETEGDNAQYDIVYGSDSSISIGLFAEPLAQARLAAEAKLKSLLQLTNVQLCMLKITVAVPYSINQFYAGKNLGLSFCSGATQLPN